jgi:hypothetical protein
MNQLSTLCTIPIVLSEIQVKAIHRKEYFYIHEIISDLPDAGTDTALKTFSDIFIMHQTSMNTHYLSSEYFRRGLATTQLLNPTLSSTEEQIPLPIIYAINKLCTKYVKNWSINAIVGPLAVT